MDKRKIKYLILFFSLVFIIDFSCGKFSQKSFYDINFGDYGEVNRGLKAKADILIIGSSRAKHHYNPKIFSENLNLSCYNAGIGGHGLFLNYAMLSDNIKINKPKLVILDVSPNVIVDKDSYSKLNSLLPYYKNSTAFREIIQLNPKFSRLGLISNLYKYNSTLYDLLRGYLLKSKNHNLGFVPLEGEISKENYDPFFLEEEKFDDNKLIYLNKIISICSNNNIKLVIVISPTYEKFDKKNNIIKILASDINNKNIEFYNYSDYSKLYKNPEYFTDQLYLNETGANIFSKDLVKRINNHKN